MAEDKQSNDPRFTKFYNDPKFRNTKNKDLKVKLDNRFSKKDLEVKKKAKVDKYGRKLDDSRINEKDSKDFDKYFEKEDEEEKTEEKTIVDRARGEVPSDYVSSSDEYTSSDSESSESEVDSEEEYDEEENEQSQTEAGDPSNTLAVVNLDWDHVRSSDLMITFTSFVPRGGKIERICIYPSEFGKERMQREEVEGPPRELFQKKNKKNKKGKKPQESDDEDEVSDVDIKDLYEEGDAEKDVDTKALRQYQLDRLRYYYAVVYCNNIDTARAIYENCDATEYESTANMFDIRYVPEGMDFDDEPRDQCDSLPKNYKPLNFSTDALQHSNVKLTWDETPADRVEIAKRAFSQKEIDDMDFKAYLASDSEDDEEEVSETMKNKLKALANSSFGGGAFGKSHRDGSDDEEAGDDSDDNDEGVDMEITFTPGLDENAKAQNSDDDKEEESTIDKIKRKEKERRKARKEKVKQLKQAAQQEKKDKLKSLKSKKGKHSDDEVDAKSKAELELLMMDDDDEKNSKSTINKKAHFNMNEILRSEKEKKKRSKYQNKERIVEDEFKPNLDDDRFKEIFEDHDFAIDPSQPDFKETSAMKTILEERSKRSRGKNNKNKSKPLKTNTKKGKKRTNPSSGESNEKSDIANIVSKLKKHKK